MQSEHVGNAVLNCKFDNFVPHHTLLSEAPAQALHRQVAYCEAKINPAIHQVDTASTCRCGNTGQAERSARDR